MNKKIIVLGLLLVFPILGFTQVVPPPVPPPPPPGLPIDGFLSWFLMGAILYGSLKKYKSSSN